MKYLIELQRALKIRKINGPILFILFLLFFLPNNSYAYSAGFDYPLGKPDGVGYYDAQNFGINNPEMGGFHLGEDWNGNGRGDSDLGDPIYSISEGKIISVGNRRGWGNVVLVNYVINEGVQVNALYGHLREVDVSLNQVIERGSIIGTVGKGDKNRFSAHLHFEIRDDLTINFGTGYGAYRQKGYLDPSEFIDAHRPVEGQTLTAKQEGANKIVLTWNKSESEKFDKYEIYRSGVAGGTEDESKRTLVFSGTDKDVVTASDEKVNPGNNYCYRLFTLYKNGMVGKSEEVSIEQKREIVQITTNEHGQQYPVIAGGRIFWQDSRTINGKNPQLLFFYDLETKEEKSVTIGSILDGVKIPMSPTANEKFACYNAADNIGRGHNIYCYSFETGSYFLVSGYLKDQFNAEISEEGIVVWEDTRDGTADIYYMDLNGSDGEKILVSEKHNQKNPKIWGNRVVWKDTRVGNRTDLYIKEIGGEEELLATNVKDGAPDIWEKWVMWEKNGKVSLINTETKEIRIVAEKSGFNPRVRDGRVVYYRQEGEFGYIYVYDITAGQETKIDFKLNYMSCPSVYENIVVFDHSETKSPIDMNIYMVLI